MTIPSDKITLLFLIIGYGGMAFSIFSMLRSISAKKWQKVRVKITSSAIETNNSDDTPSYKAKITYSYSFRGKDYTSSKIGFGYFSTSIKSFAQNLIRRFHFGSTPFAFVNPKKPSSAVLVVGVRPFHLFNIGFFTVIVLIVQWI